MIATKLKIRVEGDPCLRKKSKKVAEMNSSERLLVASMIKTMHENNGIGLAAPQVGLNKQIFVVDIGESPMAFVNPQILSKKGMDVMEEGCLSLPGVTVKVKRPQTIKVRYCDEQNREYTKEFSDLMAKVILHENDHLQGKLIIDYAGFRQRIRYHRQLRELLKQATEEQSSLQTPGTDEKAPPLV